MPTTTGTAAVPGSYEPRHAEDTLLYRVVAAELETFLASARDRGRPLPAFVEDKLREFLTCGVAARGLVRNRCSTWIGTGVRLRPESVFGLDRNGCSRWAGIHNRAGSLIKSCVEAFNSQLQNPVVHDAFFRDIFPKLTSPQQALADKLSKEPPAK